MENNIVAIMYDFDKTLSTMDMQNYSFIPKVGLTIDEFWNATKDFAINHSVEKILSYMYMMIKSAQKKGIKLTKEFLNSCGEDIIYWPGVLSWFKNINNFGKKHGIKVEHYLVSSGTMEIIEGSKIFNEFTQIYACEFVYDEEGNAIWPKHAINFTQKTQFYFRVAKGAIDINDDVGVNQKQKDLRIPFSNIVYIGDGVTDIACMALVRSNKGTSIAVYPPGKEDLARQLKEEGRANYAVIADYTKGSDLEKAVKLAIENAELQNAIKNLGNK